MHVGAFDLDQTLVGSCRILRPDIPAVEDEDPLAAIVAAMHQLIPVVRLPIRSIDRYRRGPGAPAIGASSVEQPKPWSALTVFAMVEHDRVGRRHTTAAAEGNDVLAVVVPVAIRHDSGAFEIAQIHW